MSARQANIVYRLSPKGHAAIQNLNPDLPIEVGNMLLLVDGKRTKEDLVRMVGRNALCAGALRWLAATGYVEARA